MDALTVPPEQSGSAPRKETVPGETTEKASEDVYPKQEHVLKSLPAKGGYTVIPLPAFLTPVTRTTGLARWRRF